MLDLKALLKATGNEKGSIVGEDGLATDPIFPPLGTGSYILNALLSGSIYEGLPSNKISCFAGEKGVGKTYFALQAAKEFLDTEPEGIFVYADTEASTTKEMLAERIGHLDRILVLPIRTVQEVSTQLSKLLDQWEKTRKKNPKARMLVVLDSLGNLSTTKEVTDMELGNETKDMTRAQLLKGTFRALTIPFALAQVPLVFTNHTYQGMGMFSSKTMGGGGGPMYAASQIIFLTKAKIQEGAGLKRTLVGNVIKMTNYKSRATREGAKSSTRLFFDTGLDKYYGLLDIAKKYGIWPVSAGQCVINGEKVSADEIQDNPEKYFTTDVLDLIDEACKKEFLYGSEIEAMEDVE